MTDEHKKQLEALLRDLEMWAKSNKPFPILPKDLEILREVTK